MIQKLLGEIYWEEQEQRITEEIDSYPVVFAAEQIFGINVDAAMAAILSYIKYGSLMKEKRIFQTTPSKGMREINKDYLKQTLMETEPKVYKEQLINLHFYYFKKDECQILFSPTQLAEISESDQGRVQSLYLFLKNENNVEDCLNEINKHRDLLSILKPLRSLR